MELINHDTTFGLLVLFAYGISMTWVLNWLTKKLYGESKYPSKNDAPPAQKIQIFINSGRGSGRPDADRSTVAPVKRG